MIVGEMAQGRGKKHEIFPHFDNSKTGQKTDFETKE